MWIIEKEGDCPVSYDNRPVADGVRLLCLPDDRFKTLRLTAALILPLARQTASGYGMLPYLLRRACAAYPEPAALRRRLDALYGARIYPDVARLGENQVLLLTAECIADRYALDGETVAAPCAALLRDLLFDPPLADGVFREEDVAQERRCMIERIEAEINEKRYYARRRCEETMCEGEPYAIDRYGDVEGVASLTPADVTAAWRRALREAQVQLIVQGGGDLAAAAGPLADAFAAMGERTPGTIARPQPVAARDKVREVRETMAVGQAKLVMGFRVGVAAPDARMPAARLMNAVFGGTPSSLLFANVREKLSLCYYCASSYDRHKGVLLVDSGVEEDKAAAARDEVLRQLDRLRAGDFTDGELEAARLAVINQFRSVDDLQSTQAAWVLGQCLYDVYETPEEAAAAIGRVTRGEVAAAAASVQLDAVYRLSPDAADREGKEA